MLKLPSGFLYQPSNAGLTVCPEVLVGDNGSWPALGRANAHPRATAPMPSIPRVHTCRIAPALPRMGPPTISVSRPIAQGGEGQTMPPVGTPMDLIPAIGDG